MQHFVTIPCQPKGGIKAAHAIGYNNSHIVLHNLMVTKKRVSTN